MLEGIYCSKLRIAKQNKEFNKQTFREIASRLLKDNANQENIGNAQELADLSNETDEEIEKLNKISQQSGCECKKW